MARRRQLGVALDDRLRELLESLAAESNRSIADEIRSRVERTLEQDEMIKASTVPAVVGADGGPVSAEEEIEARLSRTLAEDEHRRAFDDQTRELADDIMQLARDVQEHAGGVNWHADPKAHEALVAALTTWLETLRPAAAPPEDHWRDDDDPATVGRTLARAHQRRKREAAAPSLGEAFDKFYDAAQQAQHKTRGRKP
jgi:hypothetical protein